MATQVVELTSDEAALLRGLDKVIQKEREHERQLAASAAAGGKAGDEIAGGFAKAEREAAKSMKAALRELAKFGPAGQAAAGELKNSFEASGSFGFKGLDEVFADLEKLDPAAAEAARAAAMKIQTEMAAADAATEFTQTLTSIEQLGGAAAVAAKRVSAELKEPGSNADGLARYLDQLRALGPAGTETADRIALEFAKIDQRTEFDQTLAKLRSLGGDARAIADGIAADMVAADAAAAGDMNMILDRLKEIDPTVTASAETIKTQLAEAARFSEGKYQDTLSTLRSMGPVGKQVADQLKTSLVGAGVLAEQSIDDVIDTLRQIDPAAADAANAIKNNLDDAAQKSEGSFASFGKSAIAQIVAVAGAYGGIQEGIQAVTRFLKEQEQILANTLDRQLQLAKAQQEAAKNLAGLDVVQRDELLQQAVPSIARDTGFSDIAAITTAIGAAVSRGADSQSAADAVRQAARVEINTPEQLDDTAAGAVALQRQTGLADIRQSIALLQTTGTQSAIVDPSQLIDALPKAVGAAVSTVRNQDAEEASRQAAALFAQVTQGGNDDQGKSSATFTTDLAVRLEKFFGGFDDELIDARSKIELLDRKIDKGTATEANIRDRGDLQAFVDKGTVVQRDLQGTDAFETLFGRIETLQQNPELAKQLVGSEGFGEKQFQVVLKDLFDATSATASGLKDSFEVIQANTDFFEREARQTSSGTDQLTIASARSGLDAAVAAKQGFDIEGGALQAVRDIVSTAISETRTSSIADFGQYLLTDYIGSGQLAGSTASEEAVSGIGRLLDELGAIEEGGVTRDEQLRAAVLESGIDSLVKLLEDISPRELNAEGVTSAVTAARDSAEFAEIYANDRNASEESRASKTRDVELLTRIADLMERNAAAAEQSAKASSETATNTKPRMPDPGTAQRAAAEASR